MKTGDDAVAFFARHGNNTPLKFVYCNRSDSGEAFRPYDLTVVPRKAIHSEYFTISASGVVHISPGVPSAFVSLAEWIRESTLFNVLSSIRFFKHYLVTKVSEAMLGSVLAMHTQIAISRRRLTYGEAMFGTICTNCCARSCPGACSWPRPHSVHRLLKSISSCMKCRQLDW